MTKFGLLVCTIPIVFLFSCNDTFISAEEKPESYTVIRPERIDTVFTKEYIADIQSPLNVEIRSRLKGFIEYIHVDEGRSVKKDQLLFTLGGKELKENVLRASAVLKSLIAELKVAEVELRNTKRLAEKKIVSRTELDVALANKEAIEARIDEAKAALAIAELNQSYTEVRAPFDGVLNRIPYKKGSLIAEGDLLTTISNNQEVFAYYRVSEKEYIDAMRNDSIEQTPTVSLLMANNELFPYQGKVETIENVIDKSTGNIAFRARFRNPELLLKHGASGKILVQQELKNALVIPQKSTFEIQDKVYVFLVDSTRTIRVRNIVPGIRLPHLYVVEAGLSEQDQVLFEGIQQVKEGTRIQPAMQSLRDIRFD